MKQFLHLFLSFLLFFSSTANAVSMKGQSGSTWFEMLRTQVPYNQLTKIGDKAYQIETGNDNRLANPGFEGATVGDGWTLNTVLTTNSNDTTHVVDGKQNLKQVYSTGPGAGGIYTFEQTWTQASGVDLSNKLLEFTASYAYEYVSGATSTAEVCLEINGNLFKCNTAPANNTMQAYTFNVTGTKTAGTTYKLHGRLTYTGTGVANGYVDATYGGIARNNFSTTAPNTFSAKVSSAGVVSDESPEDWISGNCSFSTGLATCTFPTGKFSVAPTCSVIPVYSGTTVANMYAPATTTQVQFQTFASTTGSNGSQPVNIFCMRASTDYIYTGVINANQFDYDWRAVNPAAAQQGLGNINIPNAMDCRHKGDGSDILIDCKFQTGTVSASEARFALPDGYTVDAAKTPNMKVAGYWHRSTTSNPFIKRGTILINGGNQFVNFSVDDKNDAGNPVAAQTGSFSFVNSDYIYFSARIPVTQRIQTTGTNYLPAGSVTSNASGALRVEYARVGTTGAECTSTPCTVSLQSASWISTITRNAVGNYTVSFNSGVFSSEPVCDFIALTNGSVYMRQNNAASTGGVQVLGIVSSTGNLIDSAWTMKCTGPR